jgi:hypothetical protein
MEPGKAVAADETVRSIESLPSLGIVEMGDDRGPLLHVVVEIKTALPV